MVFSQRETTASPSRASAARSGGSEPSGLGLTSRPAVTSTISEPLPWTRSASVEGTIFPRGAAWIEEERAYNFSLYAQHAESVVLLLFSEDDLEQPLFEHRLD